MSDYVDLPVKDRMKAFLLSEDMADAHFSVGIGDVKERIPALKCLLASASEVFHEMLYGRFDVPETIEVADTTPEAFKLMLRYIYTDEVDLSRDNAFPVTKYIAIAYSGESVANVLPHLHLVEGEHAESVWDAIDLHADVVLKSPEFLELSHANLCDLLRRDLSVDELTVYNSAVAWTQAECTRKHLSFETHARVVLGNALKLIRFPLMSIDEFAGGPAVSNILSDQAGSLHVPLYDSEFQEKLEIYTWYGQRDDQKLTTFSSTPRKWSSHQLLSCNRFDLSLTKGACWHNTRDYNTFFNFSVSTRVSFHGVAFFGRKDESNVYEVDIALLYASSGMLLAAKHAKVTTDASEDTYKVLFDRPVLIAPGTQYKITAVSIGPYSMYAENGRREVTCGDGSRSAAFSFTDTELRSFDQLDVSLSGHIPVIYFSFS